MTELRSLLRTTYRRSPFYGALQPVAERERQRAELLAWAAAGGPEGPSPHLLKQGLLRDARKRTGARVLIETGTYLGSMVEAMRTEFEHVISIEVDRKLHELAQHRFRGASGITLLLGDSGTAIQEALQIAGRWPVVLWLDGHFSGGETGSGKSHCPVREELALVLPRRTADGILVDDAHLFGVDPAYPSLTELDGIIAASGAIAPRELRHNVIGYFPRWT